MEAAGSFGKVEETFVSQEIPKKEPTEHKPKARRLLLFAACEIIGKIRLTVTNRSPSFLRVMRILYQSKPFIPV